ncbi:RiPP maturation radical SAM C-methyltransferase [Dactylosporangium sucinum]|nr:RiPP maturation radical SAM C-methyltransferase [Dactylosporangium sucinum]
MPWMAIDTPSLAIGILRSRVGEVSPNVDVTEYHGALHWGEYLLAATGGQLTPAEYMRVADDGIIQGVGDWVFAGSLYDDPAWHATALRRHTASLGDLVPVAEQMRELADGFVAQATSDILSRDPDVVGFTTSFMQTVPSLAVARHIKRLRPEVQIVLGGAHCDGSMGHALHRNHRFVDFVARGEGEVTLPALLAHIAEGTAPRAVAGVCWWDGDRSQANPENVGTISPDLIPMPTYDSWFAAMDVSPTREYLSPYLYIEGSRGCWWGERHQCTFCGLNPATIGYRSKPADRFWNELTTLAARHQVLDVMTGDNIIDHAYYRDLLPRLVESGWDLKIQFEAKANVRPDQVAMLAAAGVHAVQFGIESLNQRVLDLMDKGVSGATNIRVLRLSEDNALTVMWNYLYGFPGELEADYWPTIEQMPALVHLQPPSGAMRILLERFSPYFERPELGFAERVPLPFYRHIYDLPDEELFDLAYYFNSRNAGIEGTVENALIEAVAQWRKDYPVSSLFMIDGPGATTVHDRRRGWPEQDHVLQGWQRAAYRLLERPYRVLALHKRLGEQGHHVQQDELQGWLAQCQTDGLVFNDAANYVALATNDVAVHLATERGEQVVHA